MLRAQAVARCFSRNLQIVSCLSNNKISGNRQGISSHRLNFRRCFSFTPEEMNYLNQLNSKLEKSSPRSLNFDQVKYIHQLLFRFIQMGKFGEILEQFSMQPMIPVQMKFKIMSEAYQNALQHTIKGFGFQNDIEKSAIDNYYDQVNSLLDRLESSKTLYNEYRVQLEELRQISFDLWSMMIQKTFRVQFKPIDLYEAREFYSAYLEKVQDEKNQAIVRSRLFAARATNKEGTELEIIQNWLDELMNEEVAKRNIKSEEEWIQFQGGLELYRADREIKPIIISIFQIGIKIFGQFQYSDKLPLQSPNDPVPERK